MQSLGFDLIVYAPYRALEGFITDMQVLYCNYIWQINALWFSSVLWLLICCSFFIASLSWSIHYFYMIGLLLTPFFTLQEFGDAKARQPEMIKVPFNLFLAIHFSVCAHACASRFLILIFFYLKWKSFTIYLLFFEGYNISSLYVKISPFAIDSELVNLY